MKRGNGEGSFRQRKPNLWEARISVKDNNGNLVSKSFYGRQKRDAKTKLDAFLIKYKNNEITIKDNVTVKEWCIYFLAEFKYKRVKQATLISYISVCENYIFPILGNKKINTINLLDCQKLINNIPVINSTRTVEITKIFLSLAFDKAVFAQYMKFNPMKGVVMPKHKGQKTTALTSEEQKLLLDKIDTLDKDIDKFLIKFYLSTGLRRAEAIALTWNDIDFNKKTINVNKAVEITNKIGETKSQNGIRIVPFNEFSEKLLTDEYKKRKSKWLFPSPLNVNTYINVDYPTKLFSTIQKEIGLNKSLRELRNTFASNCYNSGIPLEITQQWLGHGDVKVTKDVYTQISNEKMQEESKKLNNIFDNNN